MFLYTIELIMAVSFPLNPTLLNKALNSLIIILPTTDQFEDFSRRQHISSAVWSGLESSFNPRPPTRYTRIEGSNPWTPLGFTRALMRPLFTPSLYRSRSCQRSGVRSHQARLHVTQGVNRPGKRKKGHQRRPALMVELRGKYRGVFQSHLSKVSPNSLSSLLNVISGLEMNLCAWLTSHSHHSQWRRLRVCARGCRPLWSARTCRYSQRVQQDQKQLWN